MSVLYVCCVSTPLASLSEKAARLHPRGFALLADAWPLVQGLVLVRHYGAVLPLLLDWLAAEHRETSRLAAAALEVVVTHTWPRVPSKAALLWEGLARALAPRARPWPSEALEEHVQRVVGLARLLAEVGCDVHHLGRLASEGLQPGAAELLVELGRRGPSVHACVT